MGNFLNLEGLALNLEQGKWKRTAEAVARRVLAPNAAEVDRTGRFPTENITALKEAGLLGLLAEKKNGGGGESILTAVMVTEALAKGCAATAMAYHMHQTTVPVMSALATPEQNEGFMSRLGRSECLGAFAMSEPGSGNKIWHMDSFAVPHNGSDFDINSFKSFCTSSGYADFYLVPVRADQNGPADDMNLFLIMGDDPNIKCIGDWDGMGLRGNSSRPVHFDHCKVPGSQRYGVPKEGFGYMMAYSLPIYLCGMAAVYIGVAQSAYEAAVEHVKKRTHTDTNKSLAHIETIQRIIAEMRIAIDTVRFTTWRIAQHADNAMVLFNEFKASDLLDDVIRDNPDDPFFIEVASLKPAACEMVINVTNKALQVCGGSGYKRGHSVERAYRDGRAGSVMGPADDTLKLIIATQVLGLPQPWT